MRDGFRLFDTHTHIGRAQHSGRVYNADQLLRNMDRYGVDRSVVIPFPLVEDYRAAHDEIGAALQRFPGRLVGTACLNPFLPEDEFRDEIRRCVERYGFRALKLQPKFQPLNPLSPRSDFFWAAALEHNLTVIVHTGDGVPFALPALYMSPARRFPDLRMVLAHAGGSVYFQESIIAAEVCPNIRIELSTLMPHFVREILAHVPSSRLMVGSDLPESLDAEFGKILGLDVAEEIRRDILWNTAERLF